MNDNNKKYKFEFSRIIAQEDFTGAVIWGKQRKGKTSYAYQVMYDLYKDWDSVFAHTFFSIDEFIDYLKVLYDSKKKDFCILWDDAGVHGSNQLYWTDREQVQLLESLLDVIGTLTQGLIMTTVTRTKMIKAVRNYEWINIHIVKANSGDGRIAKGYDTRVWPDGKTMPARCFEDHYTRMFPDNVYKKYNEIRYGYSGTVLDALFKKREETKLLKRAQMAKAANYLERQETEG